MKKQYDCLAFSLFMLGVLLIALGNMYITKDFWHLLPSNVRLVGMVSMIIGGIIMTLGYILKQNKACSVSAPKPAVKKPAKPVKKAVKKTSATTKKKTVAKKPVRKTTKKAPAKKTTTAARKKSTATTKKS